MKEPEIDKLKTSNNSTLEIINSKIKNVKYPFNGIAPNLIDKFLVLGYEQKTIDITLQLYHDLEFKARSRFKCFEFQERPTIINEICNDYAKDLLDNDLILELMFPNIPKLYFLDKQKMNEKKEPDDYALIETYSIIFAINPQDNYGSKKSYNGLGYIFYNMQDHRNMNNEIDGYFYAPIAYVILSEFPYFYHFNEICKNIYVHMKKENDGIPIDILLYNIVKYCPSPINKTINISFGADLTKKNKNNKKNKKKMTIDKILEKLHSIDAKEDKNGIPSIFFNQLSGYPILDFNLSFIFNLIPPEIICEVFIFAFLEHDIIFYSQRPDILNMVIYIFSILNYPFNDSIYYWHLLSVSKESFMNGSSTFVGKTCSTLTGILSEYDQELLTTKKIREHFVLDIDNKNFFFLFQEETKEVQETMELYNYIKSCCAEADDIINETNKTEESSKKKSFFNDEINLYDAIFNLMEELERRAKKVTSVDYNKKNKKPTFLSKYEDESEAECMIVNMRLQKAFFSFITEITQNFLSILGVGSEEKGVKGRSRLASIQINIKKNEKEDEEAEKKKKLAKKAGNIFKNKFKDCSKYSSFVINFCLHHDTIDIYKIPYTFINEFIYYSHVAINNNMSEVDDFKIIDQFYGKKKMIDFEDIINNTIKDDKIDKEDMENVFWFNFSNFSELYIKQLREYINREQEDDREIFVRVKPTIKNSNKIYKRNGFFLSNKLLKYYINFSNKNYEELRKTFKLIKCKYIKKKKLEENKVFNGFEIIENSGITIGNNEIIENSSEEEEDKEKEKEDNNINETYLEYDKIESDKTKKDIIFYGGYELMEITDVLEKHFILERCFSSYGLIKYSLLNILAITREIENQKLENQNVITIMCDFCEKTKSLVRKYMNIYINIFQTLKDKDKDNAKKKSEYEKCLDNIYSYF